MTENENGLIKNVLNNYKNVRSPLLRVHGQVMLNSHRGQYLDRLLAKDIASTS